MERDNAEVLTPEERAQRNKYALVLPPAPERDWPTWDKVRAEYPDLCGEEQEWILHGLIAAAHEEREGRCQS